MICVSFCGHKLTPTNFTVTFHFFTFLMSCCMGFISAILEKGFNVWCSYRCSRRSVVFLEIYSHFCKQKALDPWFVMKAAFGPGCGDTASPPLLLAFRECLETSPDQWWAGASEWGTSPSLEGLSSAAVTGTARWQGAVTFTQQLWADEQMETTCPHFWGSAPWLLHPVICLA